jgi:glyoxylase-like metal-dependent hydrolase (beta-lactamase superfamily II)/8-oxo-dGTP pyrophosphatase MutT (NUDIX family)
VLLVERPATMAFAPGLHAFPGGAIDPGDADPDLVERSALTPDELSAAFGGILPPVEALATAVAAIRELFEETGILLADAVGADGVPPGYLSRARAGLLDGSTTAGDLRLRTDRLAPLSRWVTPPSYERRFDARFFVAELPPGFEPSFATGEIAGHRWLTPRAALDARAAGTIALWPPTSTTLQQLEYVRSFRDVVDRLAPQPPVDRWNETLTDTLTRIAMPSAGGVPGQSVNAYLVGRRELLLVDPGDPSESATGAIEEAVAGRGGHVRAIVLTHADPDHAAGALGLAESLKVPILVGPGGGRDLPYDVIELVDREAVDRTDVLVTVLATPGHRSDHVALLLDGAGGTTSRSSVRARSRPSSARQGREQVPEQVETRGDLGRGRIGPGHHEAGSAGQRHALELAPRLAQPAAGGRLGGSLVDEHGGRRSPDRDPLPQRTDARGQLRVGGIVAGRYVLAQVGDPVTRCHQGVVGGLRRRSLGQDVGGDETLPEAAPQPALVVVAGGHAHRRRVEAHEQQPVGEGRQVFQGLDPAAADDQRDPVIPGIRSTDQRIQVIHDPAGGCCPPRRPPRRHAD